jgi:hypothetical protein
VTEPRYDGVWRLLPELSFYEDGQPPQEGRYEINVEGKNVSFSVRWRADDKDQSISFSGPLDGQLHHSDAAPNAKVSFTHVDENTLESAFSVDEVQMAFARRQVSHDGALLAVLQVNTKPDGSSVRITQVYRRVGE